VKVLSIVGARPQFVKLAPISWAASGRVDHETLHTGQHYDELLSNNFFNELEIPNPIENLEIGSGSHGQQTGKMIIEIERAIQQINPQHIILYGDTNSTLAGAIAATKMHIPISHVEAGLRSFNKLMPEEINRILTDHTSDLLFAPTMTAMLNLQHEGLGEKARFVGDVMVETLKWIQNSAQKIDSTSQYIVATIHRAENTDNKSRLKYIFGQLKKSVIPVHLYCHPRLEKIIEKLDLGASSDQLVLMPPIGYKEMVTNVVNSVGVITDSGGLQKESFILGKPCLIMREQTEWVETLNSGMSFLDPQLENIRSNWWEKEAKLETENIFGDGSASKKIIDQIISYKSKSA